VYAMIVVGFWGGGVGRLIDNQGTPDGSRVVQLGNGRAEISLRRGGGKSVVGVVSEGVVGAVCEVG